MLSLTDFYRIKQSSLYWPNSPTLNTLSSLDTVNDYSTRAEKHKNKLRSYDKKYPYHPLLTFENKKIIDPYSVVGKEDDAIKELNILCKHAKIASIRDKQLDERKHMENMYKKKEEKLDFMMELERLKEIKYKEEQEKESKKLNLDSQKIIIEQILDNERERLKKREQIEKDKLQMRMQIEKLEEEEKKRILREKHLKEQRIQECLKADQYAILQKQKKRIEEKESELKDAKYNIEKAKKEEEYIKEKKRIALEKEKEIQALREKQEKAQDKQAELDATRAKRVYEETERKAKLKEKEEEILKAKKMKECIEENEKHRKIKEEMKINEIMKEKEEYERLAKERQREIEEEKEKQRQKIKLLIENGNMVKNQIIEKEEKNRKKLNEKYEDMKKIRQMNDAYYNSVDLIKKQKIEELRAMNINEKYIVPVEKYTPIKSLRKQGI